MASDPLASAAGLFKFGQQVLFIASGVLTVFFLIYFIARTWPQSKKFIRPVIAPAADIGEELQVRVLQKHLQGVVTRNRDSGGSVTFQVDQAVIRKLFMIRLANGTVAALILALVYPVFAATGPLGDITFVYFVVNAAGVVLPLDFHGWELDATRESPCVPTGYRFWSFLLFFVSSNAYYINGAGTLNALFNASVITFLYNNVVNSLFERYDTTVSSMTVTCPPGRNTSQFVAKSLETGGAK